MPKYEINAQHPGSYVEGFGVFPPGTVVDLPYKTVIRDGWGGEREITIEPRESWIPLDDAAKTLFAKYKRSPRPRQVLKKPEPDDTGAPAGFESKGEKLRQATPKRISDQ